MATQEPNLTTDEIQTLKQIAQSVDGDTDIDSLAEATGTSRRDILKIAAALGVGTLAGGATANEMIDAARAAPSTSDSDGNVGLPGDRVDVFAEGIDSNSVETDEVVSPEVGRVVDNVTDVTTLSIPQAPLVVIVVSHVTKDGGSGAWRVRFGNNGSTLSTTDYDYSREQVSAGSSDRGGNNSGVDNINIMDTSGTSDYLDSPLTIKIAHPSDGNTRPQLTWQGSASFNNEMHRLYGAGWYNANQSIDEIIALDGLVDATVKILPGNAL